MGHAQAEIFQRSFKIHDFFGTYLAIFDLEFTGFARAKNGLIHGRIVSRGQMQQPAEDNNGAHQPLSLEHGLLADDLRFFRALAKDAFDPSIRSGAARLVSLIELFDPPESPFRKIVEQSNFAKKVQQLTNRKTDSHHSSHC